MDSSQGPNKKRCQEVKGDTANAEQNETQDTNANQGFQGTSQTGEESTHPPSRPAGPCDRITRKQTLTPSSRVAHHGQGGKEAESRHAPARSMRLRTPQLRCPPCALFTPVIRSWNTLGTENTVKTEGTAELVAVAGQGNAQMRLCTVCCETTGRDGLDGRSRTQVGVQVGKRHWQSQ